MGASLAISIFLLAQHQEHQKKCIEEINAIFGDDERTPTLNDLREMKHLEMCIKEALRLVCCCFNSLKLNFISLSRMFPAVPIVARCLGEDVKCGKVTLPKGADIFVIPYATHRLEHIYQEPEKYIPERFSPENCETRNPYAFLPFSAGPRNCVRWQITV